MFDNIEEYYRERTRLIDEEDMNYIDACNKAWRDVMERKLKKQNKKEV